jgi:hypothetical protein
MLDTYGWLLWFRKPDLIIRGDSSVCMQVTPLIGVIFIVKIMYALYFLLGSFACLMRVESPSGSGLRSMGYPV